MLFSIYEPGLFEVDWLPIKDVKSIESLIRIA